MLPSLVTVEPVYQRVAATVDVARPNNPQARCKIPRDIGERDVLEIVGKGNIGSVRRKHQNRSVWALNHPQPSRHVNAVMHGHDQDAMARNADARDIGGYFHSVVFRRHQSQFAQNSLGDCSRIVTGNNDTGEGRLKFAQPKHERSHSSASARRAATDGLSQGNVLAAER